MAAALVVAEKVSRKRARSLSQEEEERTSGLQAPIMMLTGHESSIYSFRFSPNGKHAASAGHERAIFLWEVYGDCENYNVLRGHKNAILEMHWVDGRTLCTASADKTCALWDAHAGKRKKQFAGHKGFVNSVCPARRDESMVSGGDEGKALLWDFRTRNAIGSLEVGHAVTAVCFDDEAEHVFAGSIDEKIKCFDLRKGNNEIVYELDAHTGTITGLALSPDGKMLLSNAMDSRLHCWDIRPLLSENSNRLSKTFTGHQHDFQKILLKAAWSPDGQRVSAGSSDQVVHVWDVATVDELYYLPGHKGSVNDVHFHPTEPIVGSAGSDATIYLGEIA